MFSKKSICISNSYFGIDPSPNQTHPTITGMPFYSRGRTRLRALDLSCNPLGEAGVLALSKGLHKNTSLRHLSLRYIHANQSDADAR